MSRCDMWETSPFLSFGAAVCIVFILFAHVIWIPTCFLRCHCSHPEYMSVEEKSDLALHCIAHYAQMEDGYGFSAMVKMCLNDKEFLLNWATTRNNSENEEIHPNAISKGLEGGNLFILDQKIPLNQKTPCRLYTTYLCWFHYWCLFPLPVSVLCVLLIAAIHVQIYAEWRAAQNVKNFRSR